MCPTPNNRKERYLAVDSGGTKTAFRVLDSDGAVIAESRSGGVASLHAGELPVQERLSEGLRALGDALAHLSRVYFSLGGPNTEEIAQSMKELLPGVEITVDREANGNMILDTAALYDSEAAVMVGTGSVAVGIRKGRRVYSGGWGPALDDLGAGGRLGLEALRGYLFTVDGRADCGGTASLFADLSAGLDTETFAGRMELKRRANALTRQELAAYVPGLFRRMEEGDPFARELIRRSAEEIAELAASVTEATSMKKGIFACGGMFQTGETFRAMCTEELKKVRPEHHWCFMNTSGMISCAAIRVLRLSGVTDMNVLRNQLEKQHE